MMNMTKEIGMAESITPWDYQKESHEIYKNDLEVRTKSKNKIHYYNGRA
jgi:hypothetical protein